MYVMVDYDRHLVIGCCKGVLCSKLKGRIWSIFPLLYNFGCVIFDGYLELYKDILDILCACILV